jgi:Flp pilus assembly pilin Flp
MKSLLCYWQDEGGVTTVEYAILLGVLVVAAVAAWRALGNTLLDSLETANEVLPF